MMRLSLLVAMLFFSCLTSVLSVPVRRVSREQSTRANCYFYHVGNGYYFHRSSTTRDGTVYYKCVRYDGGCRCRAAYWPGIGFDTTRRARDHNHEPDQHYPDEVALRLAVLERCRSLDYTSYRNIIDEEGAWFAEEVASRVTLPRMRNAMRNARLERYPPPPASLEELTAILNDPRYRVITQTEDGEDNVYGGSVVAADQSHHVLFASQRMLTFMASMTNVHSDGTFKIVPVGANGAMLAQQVFAILTTWRHHVIPVVLVLMESQTENAYTAVLRLLQRLLQHVDIDWQRVVTDFERAQRNSWENVFQLHVQGCLWHLVRAFLRKLKDLGLGWWLRNDDDFRRIVRMACAIALLPRRLLNAGLVVVTREAMGEGRRFYRRIRPFFVYIHDRWVGNAVKRIWMCVHKSKHRTNNAAESLNRMLREKLGVHPGIYQFINTIVQMERCARRDIRTLQNGRQRVNRERRASAVANDRTLRRLERDLRNAPGPIDEAVRNFLRRAAHVMHGVVDEAAGVEM